jgi:hypothetical protein
MPPAVVLEPDPASVSTLAPAELAPGLPLADEPWLEGAIVDGLSDGPAVAFDALTSFSGPPAAHATLTGM